MSEAVYNRTFPAGVLGQHAAATGTELRVYGENGGEPGSEHFALQIRFPLGLQPKDAAEFCDRVAQELVAAFNQG